MFVACGKGFQNAIHHAINGKTDYFYWAMFNSYVKLPEGKPSKILGQDHTILRSLPKHIWLNTFRRMMLTQVKQMMII